MCVYFDIHPLSKPARFDRRRKGASRTRAGENNEGDNIAVTYNQGFKDI